MADKRGHHDYNTTNRDLLHTHRDVYHTQYRDVPGKKKVVTRPVLHDRPQVGRAGVRKPPQTPRRVERTGCYNPEVRKRLGGVIFALGVPAAVAGIVMTVVDATDNASRKKYPPDFSTVGPILITVAVALFIVGITLATSCLTKTIRCFFSFDDPNSFCPVHLPRLSRLLRSESNSARNRAAMDALRTEPGKSALKRQPAPAEEASIESRQTAVPEHVTGDSQENTPLHQTSPVSQTSIEFVSESNEALQDVPGVHLTAGEQADDMNSDRLVSASNDNSILSVRHCKVYPRDGIGSSQDRGEHEALERHTRKSLTTEL